MFYKALLTSSHDYRQLLHYSNQQMTTLDADIVIPAFESMI